MRWITTYCVLLALASPALAVETVQLSKSTYFDQHVTAEDRGDHYLVHFNVYVRLDQAPEQNQMRLLHAAAMTSRGETVEDVSLQRRSVKLTAANESWSFYFRLPKYEDDPARTLYAIAASVDGVGQEATVVWKFEAGRVKLGSADEPLSFYYPVGRPVEEPDGMGGFRIVVRYEVKVYYNNYETLPVAGLLKVGKAMPDSVDGDRSAKRLEP